MKALDLSSGPSAVEGSESACSCCSLKSALRTCAKVGHGQSVRRRDDCSSLPTCNVPADPHRRMCARRYLRGQSVKGGRGGTCASSCHRYFRHRPRFEKLVPASLRRHRTLASFRFTLCFLQLHLLPLQLQGTAAVSRCVTKSDLRSSTFSSELEMSEALKSSRRPTACGCGEVQLGLSTLPSSVSVLSPTSPLIRPLPRPPARRSLSTLYTRSSSLHPDTLGLDPGFRHLHRSAPSLWLSS